MFNFAWSELALIAVVALVVIGPKDLPRVMRTVGMWMRKARAIAGEFQSSIDQMVREAELDEVRKQVNEVTQIDFEQEFNKTVDPHGELQRSLTDPVLADPLAEAPKPAEPAAGAVAEGAAVAPEALPAAAAAETSNAEPPQSTLPAARGQNEAAQREGEGAARQTVA